MKTFQCDSCGQRLMFENVFCLNCRHTLGFIPELAELSAFTPGGESTWEALSEKARGRLYRKCANYERENVCNWMVAADEPQAFCMACRLNRKIPNLQESENRRSWANVEAAKRRLIYTLLSLRLPLVDKATDPEHGLTFDLLADTPGEPRVLTGHANGVVTINVAEARSDVREKMRREMGEKYRTLVGHFRHEIGHYYWDLLIRGTPQIDGYRALFGDERADYGSSIKRYYAEGVPTGWEDHYICEYASSHPWEDWAETWGNYLHIVDTLESARDAGLTMKHSSVESVGAKLVPDRRAVETFEEMIDAWLPLTFALNNINRSLGHRDIYPFLLSKAVIAKLKFVHEVIDRACSTGTAARCAEAA